MMFMVLYIIKNGDLGYGKSYVYAALINNKVYGRYSKITNLEIIVENLEKKDFNVGMENLVDHIQDNMDAIKNDFMNNKTNILESIINRHLVTE